MGVPISEAAEAYIKKAWDEAKKELPSGEYPKPKAVLYEAQKKVEQDDKEWIQLPKIRTTYKLCDDLRAKDQKRTEEQKALDKSWSVVTMAKYPIPPETLPTVLKMAALFQQSSHKHEGRYMTVREALWAARLISVAKPLVANKKLQKNLDKLFKHILEYSHQELMTELYGYNFYPMVDYELYKDLTGKPFGEPVIDDQGEEITESQAFISLKKALKKNEGRNLKQKGG